MAEEKPKPKVEEKQEMKSEKPKTETQAKPTEAPKPKAEEKKIVEQPKIKVKETVIILHAWDNNSKSGFIPELVSDLQKKDYNPITLDLPNTSAPKFEEWFSLAETEIKKIGDKPINLIGHSMGGFLALKLAEKYQVKKLVLVAPIGSKPSKEYFESVAKDLSKEELEVYKKFQDRELDITKVKKNAKEIIFLFGKKDRWINKEIRDYYTNNFKDTAKINTLSEFGHMTESEGVKKLPVLENLFEKATTETPEKTEDKEKKPEKKKKDEKPKVKKYEATANGSSMHISRKQATYICSFIKGKEIDEAIADLNQVILLKKAVPFKGEIPHRKGMMSGRYPVKASKLFIDILKALKGNSIVNGLEVDNIKISIALQGHLSSSNNRVRISIFVLCRLEVFLKGQSQFLVLRL